MIKLLGKEYNFLNYAIAFFFLSSPIETITLFEGFSIVKFSALVVLFGWAVLRFKTKSSLMIRGFVALAVYASLSVIWSIDKSNSINQILTFLWPSIIVALAMNYSIRCNAHIYLYLTFYVIGCLIAVISALMFRDATLAAAEFAGQERLTAFGQDPNTLAFLLCTGFTIVLDYFRKSANSIHRYICIGILLSLIAVILSSGSRTGLILSVLVFSLYFLSSGSAKNFFLMVLLILILSPVIYNYIPESIWDRLFQTNDLVQSGNFSERGDIWTFGLKALFDDNFVLGVGYSNFSTMLKQHFGWQMASHNTYISYLADFGITGFILFLYVHYLLFKIVLKIYMNQRDKYIFAYIIPYVVVMFVLETEYKRWMFMFGVMLEAYYKLNFKSKSSYK